MESQHEVGFERSTIEERLADEKSRLSTRRKISERPKVCPKKYRAEMMRGSAVQAGISQTVKGEQSDIYCSAECSGRINGKLLGIPLPDFVGSCPMDTINKHVQ